MFRAQPFTIAYQPQKRQQVVVHSQNGMRRNNLQLHTIMWINIPKKRRWSRSVVSDSLRPRGLQPARLLHPWDFPGKSTGVGGHFLLQGIFPMQGLNPGLPHCRWTNLPDTTLNERSWIWKVLLGDLIYLKYKDRLSLVGGVARRKQELPSAMVVMFCFLI